MNINEEFYSTQHPGQEDYWNKMAAPRFRARTFLKMIQTQQPAPASLVDLGCGNGALLRDIRARFPSIKLAGIDLAQPQIETNQKAMPSIAWFSADLCRPDPLPAELKNRFDAVTASEIIEHLEDPQTFLKNARALLKPEGGRLYLSTQSGRVGETEKRVGHMRHFSKEEIADLLSETGWTPVHIWNAGFPFHDLSKRAANMNPDLTMRRFGDSAYGPLERLVSWGLRVAFLFNSNRRGAQLFAVGNSPPSDTH